MRDFPLLGRALVVGGVFYLCVKARDVEADQAKARRETVEVPLAYGGARVARRPTALLRPYVRRQECRSPAHNDIVVNYVRSFLN